MAINNEPCTVSVDKKKRGVPLCVARGRNVVPIYQIHTSGAKRDCAAYTQPVLIMQTIRAQ